jgi:hypothetical protein
MPQDGLEFFSYIYLGFGKHSLPKIIGLTHVGKQLLSHVVPNIKGLGGFSTAVPILIKTPIFRWIFF